MAPPPAPRCNDCLTSFTVSLKYWWWEPALSITCNNLWTSHGSSHPIPTITPPPTRGRIYVFYNLLYEYKQGHNDYLCISLYILCYCHYGATCCRFLAIWMPAGACWYLTPPPIGWGERKTLQIWLHNRYRVYHCPYKQWISLNRSSRYRKPGSLPRQNSRVPSRRVNIQLQLAPPWQK